MNGNDLEYVVWDSCVVIDAIQRTEGRYHFIEPYIAMAEEGRLIIVVSEITFVEVAYVKSRIDEERPAHEKSQRIREWFDNNYVIRRNVHSGISEIASDIAMVHGLKRAADAIVIATAVYERIPVVHTFDGYKVPKEGAAPRKAGLLRLDRRIGSPPVRICVPDASEGTLWEGENDERNEEEN